MKTDTKNTKEAFDRLSKAALQPGEGIETEKCVVLRNDLSTLLLAYELELNKNKKG